ncbi:MAG: adenylate cyclase [Ramlibacter sp.]|nr:adenylate cyclase [Ramlibacter sp.]
MKCSKCLRALRQDASFCDQCGAAVGSADASSNCSSDGSLALRPGDAERRWVTIMFCDLVGSVALSERLEPEDMRALLGKYQRACKAAVELQGGSIARYVGDGLLVYFGHPQSHEDAPVRAVRAALAIVAAIQGLKVQLAGRSVDLQVRVGIETGSVLIGDIDNAASLERAAAVGSVPNIAARLQSLAAPNGIAIGAGTYLRVRGAFECQSAGEVAVKGIARPLTVYRVLSEIAGSDPYPRHPARISLPLVEREGERNSLRAAWERAKHSVPGIISICGEAGVGKSRLVRALQEDLHGDNFEQLIYNCAAQHQGSPLYPLITQLQTFLGLDAQDDCSVALGKLKDAAIAIDLPVDAGAALAVLLGLEQPTPTGGVPTRQEILDAFVSFVTAFARQTPTLMIVEDVHWCDPSTVEFLQSLAARLPRRLLLLVTHRQDFAPLWPDAPAHRLLSLGRLSPDASRAMVHALLPNRSVPRVLVDRVLERAEGIPLYLQEFASLVLDFGEDHADAADIDLASLAIPDSLQESLAARLDRMGPAKRLAQVAAVFGRSFSSVFLSALPDFRGVDITDDLHQLARRGLMLLETGMQPGDHEFSHALIRDAAYQSLAREDRQAVHRRIAQTLLAGFPLFAKERPELIAFHLVEGGDRQQAVPFLFLAGGKAMERLANIEAIDHLRRGLSMLDALPAADRPAQELRFLTALMPALCATRGYANLEVQQAFSRAYDLCIELGSTLELAPVLYALFVYYLVRADLARTRQVTLEMQRIADACGDPLRRMEVALAVGVTSLYEGKLAAAQASLHEVLAIWRPEGPQFFAAGEDIRSSTKCWLALVHWHRGDIDRARSVGQESLYRARQVAQPISLSFSMYFNVFLAQLCRDVPTVQVLGEEALALCTEKKIFWATLIVMHLGWAQVRTAGSDPQAAVAGTRQMISGLGMFRGAGARLTQTYYLSMVAEGQLAAGELDECERTLAEASASAVETGENLWLSELSRLRAEVLLARRRERATHDPQRACEALLRESLAQARTVEAPCLELRTALSLSRLLMETGRAGEVAPLLKPVLTAIHCVSDTADMLEARALVER